MVVIVPPPPVIAVPATMMSDPSGYSLRSTGSMIVLHVDNDDGRYVVRCRAVLSDDILSLHPEVPLICRHPSKQFASRIQPRSSTIEYIEVRMGAVGLILSISRITDSMVITESSRWL